MVTFHTIEHNKKVHNECLQDLFLVRNALYDVANSSNDLQQNQDRLPDRGSSPNTGLQSGFKPSAQLSARRSSPAQKNVGSADPETCVPSRVTFKIVSRASAKVGYNCSQPLQGISETSDATTGESALKFLLSALTSHEHTGIDTDQWPVVFYFYCETPS